MEGANVQVYSCLVPEKHGLYVPWGYIVAEATVNSQQTWGIRWMAYTDAFTDCFKELVSHLLPHDRSKVRPGTAAHFLVKICSHLTNKSGSEVIKTELCSRQKRPRQSGQGEPEPRKAVKHE